MVFAIIEPQLSPLVNRQTTLILLPYAGAAAKNYDDFISAAPGDFKVVVPELRGHGTRFTEDALDDMHEVAADLWDQLKDHFSEPVLLFGHSMGTLIAMEMLGKIQEAGLQWPAHVVLTGRDVPDAADDFTWHTLPSDEFWERLQRLGGVPAAVLAEERVREMFEPPVRADFKAVETYSLTPRPYPVEFTVIAGSDDDRRTSQLQWENFSAFPVKRFEMEGGHFFIFDHIDKILKYLSSVISNSPGQHG